MPLIVLTVVFHAYTLGLLNQRASFILKGNRESRLTRMLFHASRWGSALCATILHAFEAAMWAVAYYLLGALPDRKGSMLYSLGAMTTYGKANLQLEPRWQLMGTLEALDGWILFGLTTAFMLRLKDRRRDLNARTILVNTALSGQVAVGPDRLDDGEHLLLDLKWPSAQEDTIESNDSDQDDKKRYNEGDRPHTPLLGPSHLVQKTPMLPSCGR
jgi:hypothetical protein